jgi:hypothetical protein
LIFKVVPKVTMLVGFVTPVIIAVSLPTTNMKVGAKACPLDAGSRVKVCPNVTRVVSAATCLRVTVVVLMTRIGPAAVGCLG